MKKLLLRCPGCKEYTLEAACPKCGEATLSPHPPRYSPQNKYGHYRRRLKYLEIYGGEDGPASPAADPEKEEEKDEG